MAYTEDTLVQQTTAEYLEQQLAWKLIYAYNNEDFGPGSSLGRASDREVVLVRPLREKLVVLNPNLPDAAYDDTVRQITVSITSQTLVTNRENYTQMRDGLQVSFRNDQGERGKQRLWVCDFAAPENNDFLCARELWPSATWTNAMPKNWKRLRSIINKVLITIILKYWQRHPRYFLYTNR